MYLRAKVIRRHSDLQRFTFPEVTERIYLSFLALALMSQRKETAVFAKSYADETLVKGTFDQVRIVNNDLANMLAIVSGDPEITKKLKNKDRSTGHETETACSCDGMSEIPKELGRAFQKS